MMFIKHLLLIHIICFKTYCNFGNKKGLVTETPPIIPEYVITWSTTLLILEAVLDAAAATIYTRH